MDSTDQILEWAQGLAERLTLDMTWQASESGFGGYWQSRDESATGRIRARATAALDFLERFTGEDSRWSRSAHQIFNDGGDNQSMETGARGIGDVIIEWIEQVRSGQLQPRSSEAAGVREVASTDLMEQVRVLNADSSIVPAAPVVLAGAALEVALRGAVEELNLTTTGQPGISNYAKSLRAAELLSKQDMKEVEQMAGIRNQAAHGEHDLLSRERAGLMEQQVNIFLGRLQELLRP